MTSALPAYPAHLARQRLTHDGRAVLVRPVRAEDEAALGAFFGSLSGETRRLRFQRFTGALTDALMRFYTHVDYDRHMAFVCEAAGRIVGDARYVANPGARSCELGIVVADDWHHTGVAQILMQALARELGFEARAAAEDPALVRIVKKL